MITKQNGNRIVKNVKSKNGFEVYRLLCQRYNPRTDGKFLVLLNNIIEFQFGEEKDFLDNLVTWETMIDNFEQEIAFFIDICIFGYNLDRLIFVTIFNCIL